MSENNIVLRFATPDDAEGVLAIYAPYIENTSISFEYEIPSAEAFRSRMENIIKKFPYIVAVDTSAGNKIIGYAYANTFRERKAYQWAVELSIYLSPKSKGKGTGRRLYTAIEYILRLQNILTMEACITDSVEENDPYNTSDSLQFHTAMGFSLCGHIKRCGYKFGRWYNIIYMEKFLGEHTQNPAPVKTFEHVKSAVDLNLF